ncbi:MAG: hypothetical protein H6R26_2054 [Proteobacteria bacterium]|nr:hypothetical protein [Pseudomonadota bacterium]
MPHIIALLLGFMTLAGCSQDLHFKIRFDDVGNLEHGAAVVVDNQPVGEITGIETTPDGAHLVSVSLDRQHQSVATEDSSFFLADDPDDPTRKRIEIIQSRPGGKPITDGATVQGSYPTPLGTFPFGALLQEFGKAMKDFSGQVERYRKDFEKLPDSPEGKQLQQEWKKLLEELFKAQSAAEGTIKKDLVPKLQEELENLRKRLEELQLAPKKQGKPLET